MKRLVMKRRNFRNFRDLGSGRRISILIAASSAFPRNRCRGRIFFHRFILFWEHYLYFQTVLPTSTGNCGQYNLRHGLGHIKLFPVCQRLVALCARLKTLGRINLDTTNWRTDTFSGGTRRRIQPFVSIKQLLQRV